MLQRVHCPRHEEATASCVVYDDHAWCFGGCGRVELSELASQGVRPAAKLQPEDLQRSIERIRSLPLARVRGLDLPVDGDSYYILWPDGGYYKRRKFIAGEGSKYLCPKGHAKPLFVPRHPPGAAAIALVEGEINALSVASLAPPFAVASPGGVGDFTEKTLDKAPWLARFSRWLLVLDADKPGLDAAIRMKKALLARGLADIQVVLMEEDCNDKLVKGTLQDEVERWKR